MSSNPSPLITSAEHIALSSLLCNVPAPPSRNNTGCLPPSNEEYTLSPDTERQLARTLAFLSHSKDDVNHIPAVCLEEDKHTGALNVIFAVNRTNPEDGSAAIKRIKDGFGRIFSTLGNLGLLLEVKTRVLKDVIVMCSARILSRLRLAPSKKKRDSRPFKETLGECVRAARGISQQKLRENNLLEALNQFTISAREAEKRIDSWSRYQANPRLMEIVEGIYQLHHIPQLSALVHTIPNHDMDPSSRESILNIIYKVSRYREAARFLYRTAKKCRLVRKMRAIPVHLPRKAYGIPSLDGYAPSLPTKITKTSSKQQEPKLMKAICSVSKLTEEKAASEYSQRVTTTLNEGKVHAEVQLIAYCEIQKPKLYPRFLCSSKDACFLCNMLVLEYRKILTPRSHGRLYAGWRLPCLPQLAELEWAFCNTLNNHLKARLSRLVSNKQSPIYPCPKESTSFTLALSNTTRASLVSKASQAVDLEEQKDEDPIPSPYRSNIDVNGGIRDPAATEATDLGSGNVQPDAPVDSHQHTQPVEDLRHYTSKNDTTEYEHLFSGETSPVYTAAQAADMADGYVRSDAPIDSNQHSQSVEDLRHYTLDSSLTQYGRLSSGETSAIYTAGSIQIQFEYSTGTKSLEYCLKWLDVEEIATAQTTDPFPAVINAFHLEEPVTMYDRNMVYITAKGTVLKIGWYPVANDSSS